MNEIQIPQEEIDKIKGQLLITPRGVSSLCATRIKKQYENGGASAVCIEDCIGFGMWIMRNPKLINSYRDVTDIIEEAELSAYLEA